MEDNDAAQAVPSPLNKTPSPLPTPPSSRGKTTNPSGECPDPSPQSLRQAVGGEHLLDRIQQLNSEGIRAIQSLNYARALIFFEQCERELEQAAGRGSAIDREVILAVLNNEAVAYQRSQEQEKSASYVEAIIYNLKLFLDSQQADSPARRLRASQRNPKGQEGVDSEGKMTAFLARKLELAVYELQFAGLQSQCQAHQESLSNARRGLQIMKELGEECLVCCSMLTGINRENMAIFKEISEMPLTFNKSEYQALKKYFFELSRAHSEASKSFSANELTEEFESIENFSFQEMFMLNPRKMLENILDQQRNNILKESYLRKVLIVVCAYFTIGAELQQLSSQEMDQCNSIYLFGSQKQVDSQEEAIKAEMYHLMALIFALRHLPPTNQFLQQLLQIYREHYNPCATASHLSEEKSINGRLDKLTEKYKNFMMEKDISISIDDMSSSLKPEDKEKVDEKKESKKLNELLKQEVPQIGGQSYFNEVPSIDSIEMNSHSSKNQDISIGKERNAKNTVKIHLHTKLKGSRQNLQHQYDLRPETFGLTPPETNRNKSDRSRQESDRGKMGKNNQNNISKKSKSTKKSKSKAKLIQTKKIEKSPTHPTGSLPIIGLMTTVTDRSSKKIKSKRSPDRAEARMIGSASGQGSKWTADSKKIAFSDQIKLKPNQFSSVKNIAEPIRMNKVKGPSKFSCTIPDPKPAPLRFDPRNNSQGKSKGKSASLKSKASSKGKKSLTKTVPSKQKIYTSIKQTVKRR